MWTMLATYIMFVVKRLFSLFPEPLRGAYISMSNSTVEDFTVPASRDYPFPQGVSSCVTMLGGRHTYLEQGGWYFDKESRKPVVSRGVFAVDVQPGQQHDMVAVSGDAADAAAVHGNMACLPNGVVYAFGGLVIAEYLKEEGTEYAAWAPTNALHKLQLKQSGDGYSVEAAQEVKSSQGAAAAPSKRSGHALLYLPAATVSKQGMTQGALLLYGGSDLRFEDQPGVGSLSQLEESERPQKYNGSFWDTAPWLFDIARGRWQQLTAAGQGPPRLMYPAMAVHNQQVGDWEGMCVCHLPSPHPSRPQTCCTDLLFP